METIINILGWITFVCLSLVALSILYLVIREWHCDWKYYGGKIRFQMWFARWFQIISEEQAREWGLTFSRNIYGDEVNLLDGARSIWLDSEKNVYRVQELNEPKTLSNQKRCPICHYETNGEGHRCILTNEQL